MKAIRPHPDAARGCDPTLARLLAALVLSGLPALAAALPDDREQDLIADYSRLESYLDQGRTVFFGRPQLPAVITQGSLKISGLEITIEQNPSGELLRITATGSAGTPARFQQQPEVNQPVIHASGRIIVFDNVTSFLTIDVEGELHREGSIVQGHHIDYDLQSRTFKASSGDSGGQIQMRIPASTLNTDGQGGGSAQPADPAEADSAAVAEAGAAAESDADEAATEDSEQ